jgi:alpha-amylase
VSDYSALTPPPTTQPPPTQSRNRTRGHITALATTALVAATLLPVTMLAASSPAHAAATASSAALSKNVTANLFEYNWPSVAAACTNTLGPDGFAAVQVAPPEDSLDNPNHSWWDVYQPVDYSLTSRLGTPAQFQSMVSTCHAAGVKVYVDAVLNHMAAASTGAGGTSYGGQSYNATALTYPAYNSADFHSYPADCPESSDSISNWLNYTEVTGCRLEGLPDLATQTTAVRDTEAGYLNTLIADGVDGFRLDSAVNIGETDIAAVEALLNPDTTTGTPVNITQEVYPGTSGQDSRLNPTSFEPEGGVTSFDYSYALTNDFENGDIAALNSFSPILPSADASSFVTNQDTARASSPTLHYTNGSQYLLADEFLLAYGYGAPQIYSSFEFSSYDQAPPGDANGYVSNTVCGTGAWECTEQNSAIDALVGWHNLAYTDNAAVANWTTDGNNLVAFSRGSAAWIAINNGASALTSTFTTGLANGTYCDIVNNTYNSGSGTCSGTGITVSGGVATVTVPANGSVAFDLNSVIGASASPTPPATHSETVNVTVPVNTAASGLGVYLNWSGGSAAMTKVDDTHYTASITSSASTLSYKYYLGTSTADVEESGACTTISNRSLTVNNGTQNDTVLNWAGPNTCGSAEAVIDASIPSNTPAGDTVYIAGNFSVLGIGMSSANDWLANLYPMTKINATEWQIIVPAVSGSTLLYKFDLNGTWSNVEEGSSCSTISNRNFYFNGSGSSYTASDTVPTWAGLNGC